MNIYEKIFEIVDEINIIVDQDGNIIDPDSIVFISLIVRLEETFDVLIPDEFLDLSMAQSVSNLEIIIGNLMEVSE
jgi:acyl carrier protein